MSIIEKLEELLTEYDDSVHDMPLALRAIIEEYKKQEPVNCSMCPNNRDVVCAYCEGYGITQDTEGENLPCPQGCQIPVQANVFNAKPHKLFGRYVSYVSSDHPIAIGTNLFTHPPLSDETVKDAGRYRWLCNNVSNSFILTKNDDHKTNYVTAKEWIEEYAPEHFSHDDLDEIQKMKDTDTIWRLQVYPDTPIGFYVWHGATLSYAIDEAMKAYK